MNDNEPVDAPPEEVPLWVPATILPQKVADLSHYVRRLRPRTAESERWTWALTRWEELAQHVPESSYKRAAVAWANYPFEPDLPQGFARALFSLSLWLYDLEERK